MMEKEVRYNIDSVIAARIRGLTAPVEALHEVIDIVFGWYGFESLSREGFICRIRSKGGNHSLECKKSIGRDTWEEIKLMVPSICDAARFLNCLGMQPYLVIKRLREIRNTFGLKIYLDEVDILGSFMEIEFDDPSGSTSSQNRLLKDFLEKLGMQDKRQGLYGDLIKDQIGKNSSARKYHESLIKKFCADSSVEL